MSRVNLAWAVICASPALFAQVNQPVILSVSDLPAGNGNFDVTLTGTNLICLETNCTFGVVVGGGPGVASWTALPRTASGQDAIRVVVLATHRASPRPLAFRVDKSAYDVKVPGTVFASYTFGAVVRPVLNAVQPPRASAGLVAVQLAAGGNFASDANGASSATAVFRGAGIQETSVVPITNGANIAFAAPPAVLARTGAYMVHIEQALGFPQPTPSNAQVFTVEGPSITALEPPSAAYTGSNVNLTVRGANFVPSSAIVFNGAALATDVTVAARGVLNASVPAASLLPAGSKTVLVRNVPNITTADSPGVSFASSNPVSPSLQLSGPAKIVPAGDGTFQVSLSTGYPQPVTVSIQSAFRPAAGVVGQSPDPGFAVQPAQVTFPANSIAAQTVRVLAGGVAGNISLSAAATVLGGTISGVAIADIDPGPPQLTCVELRRSGQTFDVIARGLSSTREVTRASFSFAGANLDSSTLSIANPAINGSVTIQQQACQYTSIGQLFACKFRDNRGSFEYRQSFTVTTSANDVESVGVTLSNARGASAERRSTSACQ